MQQIEREEDFLWHYFSVNGLWITSMSGKTYGTSCFLKRELKILPISNIMKGNGIQMNKREALLILTNSLEEYLRKGFRFHPVFMKEFKDLQRNLFVIDQTIELCQFVGTTSI